MKKLLPLLVFCISFLAISQDVKRENVTGKIIVEGNDIDGITIYNSSSNAGTVSNEYGEFTIAVALNDLIEIRALEYQNFDLRINEAILASETISIYLIEEINKLDEVRISNMELTGNLRTDVNTVKTFNPKLDAIYFGIKNRDEYELSYDNSTQFENIAMQSQGQSMVNGLNVKNVVDQLLIPLFRSEVKDKKAAGVPEVPAESIKYYLGSNFLVDNFNVPEHRVEEFIRYVEEEEGFNFGLLNYGHEMEFLELLSKKSKTFLTTNSGID
ncbi:MAG: hypothetical protein ACI83B_000547 [Sediminicola sp.]|jgi:hypothetical protein|tara:strand:- start:998 stop:1810 length:813 start_codon:yes stop_codon:yes gene_type:complete